MPQSNGLSCTELPLITLLWLGPVSSLIRMPPELCSTFVANHRGVIRRHQVNALAAVFSFVGLKCGNARAGPPAISSALLLSEDMVVDDRDVGSIHDQDALEVRIADLETGDHHVRYARVGSGGHAVDEDAIRQSCCVDDRLQQIQAPPAKPTW